jgi:hypothetical protein
MSYMSVDLVDVETGEAFIGLVDRNDPPDFGVPFVYTSDAGPREVKRVPSVLQPPVVRNYAGLALQQRKWHPAFKHHDRRGFGVIEDKKDVTRALDWSKKHAKQDEDVWTWDESQ